MSHGRVSATVGIYAALGAIAWAATASVGHSPWHLDGVVGGSRWISLPVGVLLGGLTGAAGVVASRELVRRSRWGRALQEELRIGVAGLSRSAVMPLALASAIGEEIFFRGALQLAAVTHLGSVVGILLVTALFGMIHVPWNRRLLPWTATATVMGLVFGLLYLVTGELIAPIIAHAVINHENMRVLLARRPDAGPREWLGLVGNGARNRISIVLRG